MVHFVLVMVVTCLRVYYLSSRCPTRRRPLSPMCHLSPPISTEPTLAQCNIQIERPRFINSAHEVNGATCIDFKLEINGATCIDFKLEINGVTCIDFKLEMNGVT